MSAYHKITEFGKHKQLCLIIAVNSNIHWASLSRSGKCLVYRIKGRYIDSKGYFKGSEDSISGYINQPLAWICTPVKRGFYETENIFQYDFGDGIMRNVIKIPISDYRINN